MVKTNQLSTQMLKSLTLIALMLFPFAQAAGTKLPLDVVNRAKVDLNDTCFLLFGGDKTQDGKPAYQQWQNNFSKKYFAIGYGGRFNFTCAFAVNRNSVEAEREALSKCNSGMESSGRVCEIYAVDNLIVYESSQEKLTAVKQYIEVKDFKSAEVAIEKIEKRGLPSLKRGRQTGDFFYFKGLIYLNQGKRGEAIKAFDLAWNTPKEIQPIAALVHANLVYDAKTIKNNYQLVKLAYEHFFDYASDEDKARHPEVMERKRVVDNLYLAEKEKESRISAEIIRADELRQKNEREELKRKEILRASMEKDQRDKAAQQLKEQNERLAKQAKQQKDLADDQTCRGYGAKPGSQEYIYCRIQLSQSNNASQVREHSAPPKSLTSSSKKSAELTQGDGSNEDATCQKYGFKPGSTPYAECRQKIDLAKQEARQRQAQYQEEKRQYDEQVAAIQKERERQRGLKQLELGLRMMGGQPIQDAVRETAGMPPLPKPPGPVNQTIIMPGGRIVNCHTTGTVTNCF
jgi:hypothetical protein